MYEDSASDSDRLHELIQLALVLGATEAAVIPAASISIEDDLAALCRDPRCANYGLSAGCPPHVAGPAGFRHWLKHIKQAVVFRIDVPAEALFSDERSEVFQLLHEIAARIEQAAVRMGYPDSKAFAGGFLQDNLLPGIFCVQSRGRKSRMPASP